MSTAKIEIDILQPQERAQWDDYVYAHPDGTFFHLSGWRDVLEQAYRHPTYYLLAKKDGQIAGGDDRAVRFAGVHVEEMSVAQVIR